MKRLLLLSVFLLSACLQPVNVNPSPTTSPTVGQVGVTESATQADPTQATVRTICGAVNVRPAPEAAGAVIRWLVDGETVTVYEWRGDWARIADGQWVTGKSLCTEAR